jgi:hypothetical protein
MLEFAQFLVSYVLGDDARAAHHAGMLTDEVHPFVLVARALVAMRAGDRPARASVDRSAVLALPALAHRARAARSSATFRRRDRRPHDPRSLAGRVQHDELVTRALASPRFPAAVASPLPLWERAPQRFNAEEW